MLKTFPILQKQIDALLQFEVNSADLNNSVINCSFILLFRDLIRLFACYNDGVINLLGKFFEMNKKQCREALDNYKSFLMRLDKVSEFLRLAESVGIDRGEIPDLTRAPASLLEALETHLYHLEGGKGAPPPTNQQFVSQQLFNQQQPFGAPSAGGNVDDHTRQKYLEEEKERLREFEQRRQQGAIFNPFASQPAPPTQQMPPQQNQPDLVNFFDAPAPAGMPQQQQQASAANNPFASFTAPNPIGQPPQQPASASSNPFSAFPPTSYPTNGPFGAPAPTYGAPPQSLPPSQPPQQQQQTFNPFGNAPTSVPISSAPNNFGGIYSQTPFSSGDGSYNQPSFFDSQMQKPPGQPVNPNSQHVDQSLSSLVGNMSINQQPPAYSQPYQFQPQWQPPTQQPMYSQAPPQQQFGNPYATGAYQPQQ